MRKAVLVFVGIGIAALTLSGCAPATSAGSVGGSGGSSKPPAASGSGSSGGGSFAPGKVAMCTAFTPDALSSASGKKFSSETVETDSGDGVYGCAYELADGTSDWIVDVQEGSDDPSTALTAFDLGGPSAVKKLSGAGYPGVGDAHGVDLLVGKTVVEVYTPSSSGAALGTTDQYIAVDKAVIAALSK